VRVRSALGRIVGFAFVGQPQPAFCHDFAWNYGSLYAGTLLFWHCCQRLREAACNPSSRRFIPDDKTTQVESLSRVGSPAASSSVVCWLFALGRLGLGCRCSSAACWCRWWVLWRDVSRSEFSRAPNACSRASPPARCLPPVSGGISVDGPLHADDRLDGARAEPVDPQHPHQRREYPASWCLVWVTVSWRWAGSFRRVEHRLSPLGMLVLVRS